MGEEKPTSRAWSSQMSNDTLAQPWERTHSRQSSLSSQHSGASASSGQHAAQLSVLTIQPPTADLTKSLHPILEPSYPIDPLAREYPKPTEELDVREALNRKPGRWTLGHYIKVTPAQSPQEPRERNPEQVIRDMEAKKMEILRAQDEIRSLSLPK